MQARRQGINGKWDNWANGLVMVAEELDVAVMGMTTYTRASIGSGVAWAVYSRLSSELYAVCSHAIAMAMQPHSHRGDTATVVDGGWLRVREECKPRRAYCV